ncbi:hypothetical protein [Paenibacillus cremeus]|uniref:Uncharacterized protein n=1 Tax=Paenibacillus cremeus TaxID=2163881 RepID=A0A559KI00_9BACL|nr:hypothetical protein [Paenibacillus cremeus]TVY11765.1 hypothetical protein FPZ49_00265 [Paenibacillus cremeus]
MMTQAIIIYVMVAVLIGFMLALCIDVMRRSGRIVQFGHDPMQSEAVEAAEAVEEKPLAYPFYVDCTRELETARAAIPAIPAIPPKEINVLLPQTGT